jgi:hypothetical protein
LEKLERLELELERLELGPCIRKLTWLAINPVVR